MANQDTTLHEKTHSNLTEGVIDLDYFGSVRLTVWDFGDRRTFFTFDKPGSPGPRAFYDKDLDDLAKALAQAKAYSRFLRKARASRKA